MAALDAALRAAKQDEAEHKRERRRHTQQIEDKEGQIMALRMQLEAFNAERAEERERMQQELQQTADQRDAARQQSQRAANERDAALGRVRDMDGAAHRAREELVRVERRLATAHGHLWPRSCAVCCADRDPEPDDEVVACCPGQEQHGICRPCLDGLLAAASSPAPPRPALKCSICNADFSQEAIGAASRNVFTNYVRTMAEEEGAAAARAAAEREGRQEGRQEGGAAANLVEISVLRAPCCGVMVSDFGGCCSIQCGSCPAHWCAFCFEVNLDGNMHDHLTGNNGVAKCPVNPCDSFFAYTPRARDAVVQAWNLRRGKQVLQAIGADPSVPIRPARP